jgi:hypothetical protein
MTAKDSFNWFRDYKKSDPPDKKKVGFAILGLFAAAGIAMYLSTADLSSTDPGDHAVNSMGEVGRVTRVGNTELRVVHPVPQ